MMLRACRVIVNTLFIGACFVEVSGDHEGDEVADEAGKNSASFAEPPEQNKEEANAHEVGQISACGAPRAPWVIHRLRRAVGGCAGGAEPSAAEGDGSPTEADCGRA